MYGILCRAASAALDLLPEGKENAAVRRLLQEALWEAEEVYLSTLPLCLLSLTGPRGLCYDGAKTKEARRMDKPIPIIIDADPGVDDALALKMAFGCPKLDIRLLCSVAGNVSIRFTTANALFLTKKYGGDIPVARGSASPLSRQAVDASSVHGERGIGNYVIPEHDYKLDSEDGIEAMYVSLKAAGEPVTLVTLGPLTNIAALLAAHPDALGMIGRIYAMIASMDGTGNITPYAEFNAYCDPEALDAVVRAGAEIVFAPMHLGRDARLSQADILARGAGSEFGAMLERIFTGYRDDAAGEGYVAMYDANAVEALLHPELYDFIRCTAEVNVTDRPGQTCLRPDGAGRFFYLEIRDRAGLAEAMLSDLFPA